MNMGSYLDTIDALARRRRAAAARLDFTAVIGCAADLTRFLVAEGEPFAPQDQHKTLMDVFLPPLPFIERCFAATMQKRD
jgi:hypothetical protein